QQTRHDHFAQGRAGGDVDTAAGLGFGLAFENARNGAELAADFLHHGEGRAADRHHATGGEQIRYHAAHQQADQHHGVGDLDRADARLLLEGGEQHHGRERGGGGGEALADGGGGVAHGVELVGVGAHAGRLLRHLGEAAGVVGDGPEGVDRQLDAQEQLHTQRGDRHAEQAGLPVTQQHGGGHHEDGQRGGGHPHAHAGDDVGGRAGLGSLDNGVHRLASRTGVVFGQQADGRSAD